MWSSAIIAAGGSLLSLELDSVESSVDVFQRVGSPAYPSTVFVTVKDTAVITTITTGAMVAGSVVYFVLEGYFLGQGGNGGQGAYSGIPAGPEQEPGWFASPGQVGGDSLDIQCNVFVNAELGRIWGGAGGGGGGGAGGTSTVGGGGGGGVSGGSGFGNGTDATSGISAVPGTGGDFANGQGVGGDGGDWGGSGNAGTDGTAGVYMSGAAGGNGGLAIAKNGFALTFVGKTESQLRAENRILGVIA